MLLSVTRERLLSCSFKYLGSTAPSSAKPAGFHLTVDHLISMPGAQDVLEGLSDNRWSRIHTVHLISGHVLLGCVYLVLDSKKAGNEDVGLMSARMPRTKAFILCVQLF